MSNRYENIIREISYNTKFCLVNFTHQSFHFMNIFLQSSLFLTNFPSFLSLYFFL